MNVTEPMTPYAFYWILFIFIAILSYSVQGNLNRKFKKYSKVPTRDGSSGYEVACRMLSDHGISNVKVTCVDGQLTDHYNPENNTVNLSKDVYYGRTMMAAAVAAHECGHAVQLPQYRCALPWFLWSSSHQGSLPGCFWPELLWLRHSPESCLPE